METLIKNPEAMQDIGFFWVFVIGMFAAAIYFGPSLKKWLEVKIAGSVRLEQIIDNCNRALENSTAAINNNTEALRENKEDRDKNTAILIEHDAKSEIRFQHQSETLNEIKRKL